MTKRCSHEPFGPSITVRVLVHNRKCSEHVHSARDGSTKRSMSPTPAAITILIVVPFPRHDESNTRFLGI